MRVRCGGCRELENRIYSIIFSFLQLPTQLYSIAGRLGVTLNLLAKSRRKKGTIEGLLSFFKMKTLMPWM